MNIRQRLFFSNNATGIHPFFDILLEDGSFLLLEDGLNTLLME